MKRLARAGCWFVALAALGVSASAAEVAPTAPAAQERQLGTRIRPTVVRADRARAEKRRELALGTQIPAQLRAALAKAIDRRIVRNLAASRKLRAEAKTLLQRFIAEAPPESSELPESLLRLAELEWEDGRDQFLAAFGRWQKLPPEVRQDPPTPDYTPARKLLKRLLLEHKRYADYDLALYVDGFLASEEGKGEESLGRFEKILAWFPRSRFVPDAHMIRAEHELGREAPDYQRALTEYEFVLRAKGSELHDIAEFKSAWCLWRLDRKDEAAARFLKVFAAADSQLSRGAGRRKSEIDELQQEALRNLVAVFVEDERNSAEDMHRFIARAGGARFAGRIVRALAETLYEQAQYERGIQAYRLLVKLEPHAPDAVQHQLAIARGYSTMEAWSALETQYRATFTEHLAPLGAAPPGGWWTVRPPTERAAAATAIARQLREDAVGLHAKAQVDKNSRIEYSAAARLYELYLSRFGQAPEAYELEYNLAEIYAYHLEEPQAAARHYLAAARHSPSGALSHDALYNALGALERLRGRELADAKARNQRAVETSTDKQLTEVMELFVKSYPKDAAIPGLLFRQGSLYYDSGVYDAAVRQLGLLVERYPNDRNALQAGERILDAFNRGEDYRNIEVWARRLKAAPAFQSSAQQKRLDTLVVQAIFKQGEALAKAGKHADSAQAYLRAARELPTDPRSAQAGANAVVEARAAGELALQLTAVELLEKHHPTRQETADSLWIAATTHQEVGLLEQAGLLHLRHAQRFTKSPKHKDAAYDAVVLLTAVGQNDRAIDAGKLFEAKYRRDPLAVDVALSMGKAHESAKRFKEAAELYTRFARDTASPNARVESLVRLAAVQVARGEDGKAKDALERAQREAGRSKNELDARGRYYAAKARYLLAERILAEFERIAIAGTPDVLRENLRKKNKLLKEAATVFTETAKLGVAEWTTAALYQVGFVFESFAKALLSSQPPPNLTAEQKSEYAAQIDEVAIPIEERALEAYESGWKKAIELGIYNEWTARMRAALGRLNAKVYPPLVEIGLELRTRGAEPLPPLIGAPRRSANGTSKPHLLPSVRAAEAGK